MADSYIQVPPDSTGKLVDQSVITTSSGTVQRQRVVIGDDSGDLAGVTPSADVQVDLKPLQRLQIRAMAQANAAVLAASPNGFVPIEIPEFLGGF